VIARTIFGKGVSFMESRIEWHYLPMSDEHFAQAMEELEIAQSSVGEALS
jgi:transketolase